MRVGVEDQRCAGIDPVQARGQRRLLAEIARQPQQRHPWIGGGDPLQCRPGTVAAAVVDVEHAAIDTIATQPIQHRGQPRMQHGQGLGLVEGGNDDGEQVCGHGAMVAGTVAVLTMFHISGSME
jgi:hypothetical protein